MFYKAHKEGAKIILVSTIVTALLFILIDQLVSNIEWLRIALMLVVLVFFVLILQFFRNLFGRWESSRDRGSGGARVLQG